MEEEDLNRMPPPSFSRIMDTAGVFSAIAIELLKEEEEAYYYTHPTSRLHNMWWLNTKYAVNKYDDFSGNPSTTPYRLDDIRHR